VANHRHKRDTNARLSFPRAVRIAAPIAAVATVASVSVGVLASQPEAKTRDVTANQASFAKLTREPDDVSRSSARDQVDANLVRARRAAAEQAREGAANRAAAAATVRAIRNAKKKLWTTEDLNLRSGPEKNAPVLGTVEAGKQVLVTGRRANGRAEIVISREARWVTAEYLSAKKPEPGIGGSCTNGTSVPSGVSENIKKVHQAVCAAFPEISTYGTFRGDGEHGQGIAVDIMVSGDRGWEVAEFVREHYQALGVSYVIYSQNIWSVQRGGEGWRGMSDRGSTTANHYDHVHVTTY
jgi:uncharacterized protein YraI